jgi:Cdc6-like AAA superfamily ATPase
MLTLSIPEGSMNWFINSPEYKRFLSSSDDPTQFLWYTGKPGTGKTAIATYLVCQYMDREEWRKDVTYFFYNPPSVKESRQITSSLVVSSIIAQLLHKDGDRIEALSQNHRKRLSAAFTVTTDVHSILSRIFVLEGRNEDEAVRSEQKELLSNALSAARSMGDDILWTILESLIMAEPDRKLFIIVDGVDESLTEERSHFLRNLRHFWNSMKEKAGVTVKILVTSRDYSDIRADLDGLPYINQEKEENGKFPPPTDSISLMQNQNASIHFCLAP